MAPVQDVLFKRVGLVIQALAIHQQDPQEQSKTIPYVVKSRRPQGLYGLWPSLPDLG